MVFGMPTLLECRDLSEATALCRELGLEFVELNMNLPHCQLDQLNPAELRAIAGDDLFFTLHLDENLNPFDFNPLVAEAYRKTALGTIELAKRIGAPVLNMHLPTGVYFSLPRERAYLFECYPERARDAVLRFRDDCARAIGGKPVMICIENCNGFLPHQLSALKELLECEAFQLTLDVGHAHAAGGADDAFYQANLNRLRHMHLHDARGRKAHLSLDEGELDIADLLRMAEAAGCERAVIEIKEPSVLRSSVRALNKTQGYARKREGILKGPEVSAASGG